MGRYTTATISCSIAKGLYLRELYRSLTAKEESLYDSLKSALTSHLEPLDQSELYRTEFKAKTKRDDERLLGTSHIGFPCFSKNGACTKRSAVAQSTHRWPD